MHQSVVGRAIENDSVKGKSVQVDNIPYCFHARVGDFFNISVRFSNSFESSKSIGSIN